MVNPNGTIFYLRNDFYSVISAYGVANGTFLFDINVANGGVNTFSDLVLSMDGTSLYFGAAKSSNGSPSYYSYSTITGEQLWVSSQISDTVGNGITAPVVGNGMIVVAQETGIWAFDVDTGSTIWYYSYYQTLNVAMSKAVMDPNGYLYFLMRLNSNEGLTLVAFSPKGTLVRNFSAPVDYIFATGPAIDAVGAIHFVSTTLYQQITVHQIATALMCNPGYYDPVSYNSSCLKCSYPFTNYKSGSLTCPNVWLNFKSSLQIIVMVTLSFIVILSIVSGERKVAIFFLVLFPTLDFFSDVAYIMTNKFENVILLFCTIGFVMLNMLVFVKELLTSSRYPACSLAVPVRAIEFAQFVWRQIDLQKSFRFIWGLAPSVDKSVLHGFIVAFLCTLLVFAVTIAFILIVVIIFASLLFVCMICAVARFPLVLTWFSLGAVLHASKGLCVGRTWFLWVRVWGYPRVPSDAHVSEFDTKCYNESMLAEFLLEAFPQLILQAINNTLVGDWSQIAIFSAAISAYMTLDSVYRMVYSLRIKKHDFVDIPVKPPLLSLLIAESDMPPDTFVLPPLIPLFASNDDEYVKTESNPYDDRKDLLGHEKPLISPVTAATDISKFQSRVSSFFV